MLLQIIAIGLLGSLISRLALITSRSAYSPRESNALVFIDFFSTMMLLSIFILTFFLYTWWVVLLSCFGFAMIAGFIINNSTLGLFYSLKGLINILIIILGGNVWYLYLF